MNEMGCANERKVKFIKECRVNRRNGVGRVVPWKMKIKMRKKTRRRRIEMCKW